MAFHDSNPNDNDFDGLPGSDEDSVAYDRLYDPEGAEERTNLLGIANRQEASYLIQRRNDYIRSLRSEMQDTLTRVQYWPHAGRFVIPKENSYMAHLTLVREGNAVDIQFDPKTYLYFDKVIAERANRPELTDPNHPDYAKYETLRENIAVLRNDIMGIYMEDGSFDPGDEKYLPRLAQIAAEIGEALGADNRWKKVAFPSLDTETANIEGEGAAHIYEFITKRQVSHSPLGRLWATTRRFMGQPDNQWELPPIAVTAFSQAALSQLPPAEELANATVHDMRQRTAEQAEELNQVLDPNDTHAIRDVSSPERREAVKHGKLIIEWLRNIQFTDKSLTEFVDSGRPGEVNAEKNNVNIMINAYSSVMSTAFKSKPELFDDPTVKHANEALENLEHAIALMAKLEKPHSQEDAMDIGTEPDNWKDMSKETVKRLIERLKDGLSKAMAELELQQQEADVAGDAYAMQQIEDSLAMQKSYNAKRSKKKGVTQQQRIDQALRADDRAAGQGAYSDDEDSIRIAMQKAKVAGAAGAAAMAKKPSDEGTKSGKNKGKEADESMEAQVALDQAMNKHIGGKNTGAMPVDNDLVKQLGKNIMHMQQQANVAASEVADMKGGGVGTGESHTDRQNPSTNPNKNKPQIG